MKKRFRMSTKDRKSFIEFDEYTSCLHERDCNERFKGMHIKEGLQAYPSKIKTGVIYDYS